MQEVHQALEFRVFASELQVMGVSAMSMLLAANRVLQVPALMRLATWASCLHDAIRTLALVQSEEHGPARYCTIRQH